MHSKKKTKSARESAYEILRTFERNKPRLDELLTAVYAERGMDENERRFLKNLTSGVLRHLLYLDWMAAFFVRANYKKMLTKNKIILRLAFYERLFLKQIPSYATVNEYVNLAKHRCGLPFARRLNAILRNFDRAPKKPNVQEQVKDVALQISIRYSFPLWLVKRWLGFWGAEETERLCGALNQVPEFDLVVNERIISVARFKEYLQKKNISFRQPQPNENLLMTSDVQAVAANGWFEKGYCRIQDKSARLPVALLNLEPADLVLDMCAAPGGKFMQILESGAQAVAVDINLPRLKKVRQNARRLGSGKAWFVCADGRRLPFRKSFTKILLDAPCSGLGVIRKHPDIKWRREFNQLMEFAGLQQALLKQAALWLLPGGRLVYSTCTLDYLENENICQTFIKKNTAQFEYAPVDEKFKNYRSGPYLRTFPHRHQSDGSFCAVFQKKRR